MKLNKKEYIHKLGNFLIETETTMSVPCLAEHLNWNGYRTDDGSEYEGKRGTYRLVKTTCDWLREQGLLEDADNVASAFPKPDGDYAFE